MNDEPSLDTELADAPAEDSCETPSSPAGLNRPPPARAPVAPEGCRLTCCTVQLGSLIEPVCPPAVADVLVKVTCPKFANGSAWTSPLGD